jgi:hypothetical protein
MSWRNASVRSIAAAVVVACASLVVADVPSSFPATYTGRQRIDVTFTLYRGASARTFSGGERINGSVVFDDASNLHFTPDYPDGTVSATYSQSDDDKVTFTYDATNTETLRSYYHGRFVEEGVLRSTDEFEIRFRDGKFVFRDGIAKLRGRQAVRFKAKRNGNLILRGNGTITWRGSQPN